MTDKAMIPSLEFDCAEEEPYRTVSEQHLNTSKVKKEEEWCRAWRQLPKFCLTSLFLLTHGTFSLHE